MRGRLARDLLLIRQLSAADIQRVWRSHAARQLILEQGGALRLLPWPSATSGDEELLSLEIQVRSLRILHSVLQEGRMIFGQHCGDLRSFFRAADRGQHGAIGRDEVRLAFERLDLGFSVGQLTSLIGTLWAAAPMSPREIRSASTPRGKGSNRIGAGDNTMPPPLITGSPVVLSSLLMDSVTEDEFVDWATPQRAELAAFILRRRHKRRGASSDVGIVPTRRSLGGSMDAVAAAPSGRGRGRGVVPEGIPPAVPVAL